MSARFRESANTPSGNRPISSTSHLLILRALILSERRGVRQRASPRLRCGHPLPHVVAYPHRARHL